MVRIQDIAHYGCWFPDERDYTLWWFDREKEKMIDADELCKLFNCDVHSLNSILCDNSDFYIACFCVDIPAFELEYACKYLDKRLTKDLKEMDSNNRYREFQTIIERENLVSHWYEYELNHLCDAAEQWCRANHMPYKL